MECCRFREERLAWAACVGKKVQLLFEKIFNLCCECIGKSCILPRNEAGSDLRGVCCGSDLLGWVGAPCASCLPPSYLPTLLPVSSPTDKSDGFMWKFCGDKYLLVSRAGSECDSSCAIWK